MRRPRPIASIAARLNPRPAAVEAPRWAALRIGLLDDRTLHEQIAAAVVGRRPFAFGRPGILEARMVAHGLGPALSSYLTGRRRVAYPTELRQVLTDVAGIHHADDAELHGVTATMVGAMAACDVLGVPDKPVPGFSAVIEWVRRPEVGLSGHAAAEPRAALDAGARPWTHALAGRRVLVVHPFAASIVRQYGRWRTVTGVRELLADFDLVTLVPPVTHGGATSARTWHDELADATARMSALDFDVAIVGAGGYGLPLVAHARAMGRVGVHLAGATQLLFGIRGGRWRERPRFARDMDATWVDPDPSEIPPDPSRVEGGAYW